MSLTDEQWKAFPWSVMTSSYGGGRIISLSSGVLGGGNLRLVEEWKTRFNLSHITDRFLTIRMQLERTPEELAVAMGKHPRLGRECQLGQLEPEVLQLICDLAYY